MRRTVPKPKSSESPATVGTGPCSMGWRGEEWDGSREAGKRKCHGRIRIPDAGHTEANTGEEREGEHGAGTASSARDSLRALWRAFSHAFLVGRHRNTPSCNASAGMHRVLRHRKRDRWPAGRMTWRQQSCGKQRQPTQRPRRRRVAAAPLRRCLERKSRGCWEVAATPLAKCRKVRRTKVLRANYWPPCPLLPFPATSTISTHPPAPVHPSIRPCSLHNVHRAKVAVIEDAYPKSPRWRGARDR